jgi:phage shock protein A
LQERIEALKETLEVHQELETSDPEKVKQLEQNIMALDAKLQQLISPQSQEVKHTMIFSMPEKKMDLSIEDVQTLEKMLPLPPPPKMRI